MTIAKKRAEITQRCVKSDCYKCPLHNIAKNDTSCSGSELPDALIERNYLLMFGIEGAPAENEPSTESPENDPVNRPSHYTDGKIEVIEFIEDKNLGFCLGNAVKYIARAGKKDPTKEIEDLNKAKWYIERRIKELKEVQNV